MRPPIRPRPRHLASAPAVAPALALALAAALALPAPSLAAAAGERAATGSAMPSEGVAWQAAASDADIEQAFTRARADGKPVLLYWGAAWCPPCNQLKATLFNRADFIARSRHLVPVFVDGDGPGAQKLGARFKVRGYPTMVLLAADGREITRLPGEAEPTRVMNLLQLGLSGGRPAKAVLADARAGTALKADDWRLLAYYGWGIDEDQLVPSAERPGLLAELAARATRPGSGAPAESATRLLLQALAASDEGQGLKPDAALRQRVQALLDDAAARRAQMDVLVNSAADITEALAPAPGAARDALARRVDAVLRGFQADATLSRGDQLSALASRVALARLGQPKDALQPKLPSALVAEVQAFSARQDREIRDGYERQAVITGAAWLLGQAGQWPASDALLKANLAKSHSPYYLMSQLAGNARKQGRRDEALDWYRQSFETSVGPATRLQWGAGYVSALVELAPTDPARIEAVVSQLLREAAADPGAFSERSGRSLKRMSDKLAGWNGDGRHDAVMQRLRALLSPQCGRLDTAGGQRALCEGLFRGAVDKA